MVEWIDLVFGLWLNANPDQLTKVLAISMVMAVIVTLMVYHRLLKTEDVKNNARLGVIKMTALHNKERLELSENLKKLRSQLHDAQSWPNAKEIPPEPSEDEVRKYLLDQVAKNRYAQTHIFINGAGGSGGSRGDVAKGGLSAHTQSMKDQTMNDKLDLLELVEGGWDRIKRADCASIIERKQDGYACEFLFEDGTWLNDFEYSDNVSKCEAGKVYYDDYQFFKMPSRSVAKYWRPSTLVPKVLPQKETGYYQMANEKCGRWVSVLERCPTHSNYVPTLKHACGEIETDYFNQEDNKWYGEDREASPKNEDKVLFWYDLNFDEKPSGIERTKVYETLLATFEKKQTPKAIPEELSKQLIQQWDKLPAKLREAVEEQFQKES